jgi:hypothetical protein
MAELMFPNIAGNAMAAFEKGRERRDRKNFNMLAGQAYGAPQDDARGLVQQAVAINPTAGFELGERIAKRESSDLTRAVGAARYMKQAIDSKNPAQVTGAWNAVRPYLAKIGAAQGMVPPEQWSDDLLPKLHEVLAMGEGAQGESQPTGFREAHMKLVAAGYTPGSDEYKAGMETIVGTKARPSSAAIQYMKKRGADGVEYLVAVDPRDVGAHVIGAGDTYGSGVGATGAQAPPQPGGASAGAGGAATRVEIDGVDPQLQQRIASTAALMAQGGFPQEQIDAFVDAQLQQSFAGQQAGTVPAALSGASGPRQSAAPAFGGRTPEQQAALDTTAQERAKLDLLPERGRIEAQNAALSAQAQAGAKAAGEAGAKRAQRSRDAEDSLGLLAEAERLLPDATGSGVGAIRDSAFGALGLSTVGAQATAALKTIAGQLVAKMPRMEGPQSNFDVQMYKEMAGDLANPATPVEQRQAALVMIRKLQQKYAPDSGPADESPPAADGGIDDLLSKYGAR